MPLRAFRHLWLSLIVSIACAFPAAAQITQVDPNSRAPSTQDAPATTSAVRGPEGAYRLVFGGNDWIDVAREFRVAATIGDVYLPANSITAGQTGKACVYGESNSGGTSFNACEGTSPRLQLRPDGAFRMNLPRGYPFERGVEVRLNKSGDGYTGFWRSGDRVGRVQMKPLAPKITHVFVRASHGGGPLSEWSGGPVEESVPTVSLEGLSQVFPNRPGATGRPSRLEVRVLGQNLFGGVSLSVPENRGLRPGRIFAFRNALPNGARPPLKLQNHQGVTFGISAFSGAPPGIVTLAVANQRFPINLAWEGDPPKADDVERPELDRIVLLDERGKVIPQIIESVPFRVAAIYDSDHPDAMRPMSLEWAPKDRRVLRRDDIVKALFVSDLFYVPHFADQDLEGSPAFGTSLRGAAGDRYNPETTREILSSKLAGRWAIAHDGALEGQPVSLSGIGVVASGTAPPIRLVLGDGSAARSFAARDVFARTGADGTSVLVDMLLREIPRLRGETAQEAARRTKPAGAAVPAPVDVTTLMATVDGTQQSFQILRTERRPLTDAKLRLAPDPATSGYRGVWIEKAPTSIQDEAVQRWTRAADLKDAQPLQEQGFNQATPPGFEYPFDRNGAPNGASATRRVLVSGTFPSGARTPFLSDDPKISYRVRPIDPAQHAALRAKAREVNGPDAASGPDLLVFEAVLAPGVQEGEKTVRVAGDSATWPLHFARTAALRFVRPGTPARAMEGIFHPGETLRVALDVSAGEEAGPMDGLDVELFVAPPRGSVRSLGTLPVVEEGIGHARTGPIRLLGTGPAVMFQPDPAEDALDIAVAPGSRLLARPVGIRGVPAEAVGEIALPEKVDSAFDAALKKVAACTGQTFEERGVFAHKASATFTRNFMFSFRQNVPQYSVKTRVLNGDHAALIVLRDQLEPMLRADLARMRGSVSDAAINRLFNRAKTNAALRGSDFWSQTFQMPVGRVVVDFKLRDLFTPEKLRAVAAVPTGVNAYRDFVIKTVRPAYENMIRESAGALQRVVNASDCDVEELLIIAGQRSQRVLSAVMPSLVRQVSHVGPPPRISVEPDRLARRFVASVPNVGAEIRAIEDFAQMDRAYQALAVTGAFAVLALPAAVGATLAEAGGGTAALLTSAAAGAVGVGDLLELGLIAPEDIGEYLKRERDAATIRGMALQMDPDVQDEFDARRDTALAGLAAVFPALGVAQGVKAVRSARDLQKGRRLIEGLDPGARASDLPDASRALIAGAYEDSVRRVASGVASEEDLQLVSRVHDAIGGHHPSDLLYETIRTGHLEKPARDIVDRTSNAGRMAVQSAEDGAATEIRIGQFVAGGVGAQVFEDATAPGAYVYRFVAGDDRVNDFKGRTLLEELPDDVSDVVQVAKRDKAFLVPGDGDMWVERVQRLNPARTQLSRTIDPRTGERLPLAATGSQMTDGQALALAAATRALNRQGLAWTDNHAGNYRFVRLGSDEAADQWKVVIIDPGNVYRAKGATAAERYANARRAQTVFNAGNASENPQAQAAFAAFRQMHVLAERGLAGRPAWKNARQIAARNRNAAFSHSFAYIEPNVPGFEAGWGAMASNRPVFSSRMAESAERFEEAYSRYYGDLARLPPIPK